LVVASDFVRTGGMDVANLGFAEYLGRGGKEVHLVTHRAEATLTKLPSVITHFVTRPLDSNLVGEMLLGLVARSVYRQLKERLPIVVVNGGNARIPSAANWIHFVHKASDPKLGCFRRLVRLRNVRRERQALAGARVVVADSLRTAADLRDQLGIEAARIHTVYYGVDGRQFFPATAEQKACLAIDLMLSAHSYHAAFVGALGDGRKGFETVFGAWEMLERSGDWDVGLLVVGAGRERERWIRLARDRQLRSIRFLGFRNDVSEIVKAVDLMVAPSRYEPYGLAVHESLCCGTPAIVSGASGVAEQFTPELKGLLLDDPRSVKELARKVTEWRANIEGYRRALAPLGARLRLRSWDDMARDIVNLCEGIEQDVH
jgi:glycosyltransferase involved in cell wall biosynthesis